MKESKSLNTNSDTLAKMAVENEEGILTHKGAVGVRTGKYTGRSAKDKFIVKHKNSQKNIWWDNNKSMNQDAFNKLYEDFKKEIKEKNMIEQNLIAGADQQYAMNVRVITQFAWHALFIRHLLRIPNEKQLKNFEPELTIINLPQFKADVQRHQCRSEVIIAMNLERGIVLIGGTQYGGEIKKSVFSVLNYILPEKNVMPMHCSANTNEKGEETALFFGLSGTGKTTLSSQKGRILIGDDEHGWSNKGIYNFEGGCYAKTLNLNENDEPEIYNASQTKNVVMENVAINPKTKIPDFNDDTITQNGRLAYPLEAIANASKTGTAGHPKNIFMLTADAWGIMPPIAELTPEQAMYHFLCGYTAKVAGTEEGVKDVEATFSTCFGAPFMPRHPHEYGELLRERIQKHKVRCWLINTGWTAGKYGVGYRIAIRDTRTMLNAAINAELNGTEMRKEPIFGLNVPTHINGVEDKLLTPRETWENKKEYDKQAEKLVKLFIENFKQFKNNVPKEIIEAGPQTEK